MKMKKKKKKAEKLALRRSLRVVALRDTFDLTPITRFNNNAITPTSSRFPEVGTVVAAVHRKVELSLPYSCSTAQLLNHTHHTILLTGQSVHCSHQ